MNNINKDFWKNFYENKDNIEKIKENSSFSSFVYEKYISEYNRKFVISVLNLVNLKSIGYI